MKNDCGVGADVEQIAVTTEQLADAVRTSCRPTSCLNARAPSAFDDATFYLDEMPRGREK